MSTEMYMLFLGALLGSGLVLAFFEIRRQYRSRAARRHEQAVAQAIAILSDHTVIGTNEVDWDSLKGWGVIDSNPVSTPDTEWAKPRPRSDGDDQW